MKVFSTTRVCGSGVAERAPRGFDTAQAAPAASFTASRRRMPLSPQLQGWPECWTSGHEINHLDLRPAPRNVASASARGSILEPVRLRLPAYCPDILGLKGGLAPIVRPPF